MSTSIFGDILDEMIGSLPDAIAAVFADWDGEAVDNVGEIRATDICLAGAHWGIIYYLARDSFRKVNQGTPREVVLRFSQKQYVVRHVTDDYYVVVESRGDAHVGRTLRALDLVQAKLLEQM